MRSGGKRSWQRERARPRWVGWISPGCRRIGSSLRWRRRAAELQASLDLGRGPLVRGRCSISERDGERLLLVAHHLVVDGVSWRVLLEDLQVAYEQRRGAGDAAAGEDDVVRALGERLDELARSGGFDAEAGHWLSLGDEAPARCRSTVRARTVSARREW